jgi:hypothetical protein
VQNFGEGLSQAVSKSFHQDGAVVVVLSFVLGDKLFGSKP